MDLNSEINSLFKSIEERKVNFGLLSELGVPKEDRILISRLSRSPEAFKRESKVLNAEKWVQLLNILLRGYIKQQFSNRYSDLLFTIWRLRALAFCINEAASFEEAERNTKIQADYAYKFGQKLTE
jgi:hypothetical protein